MYNSSGCKYSVKTNLVCFTTSHDLEKYNKDLLNTVITLLLFTEIKLIAIPVRKYQCCGLSDRPGL